MKSEFMLFLKLLFIYIFFSGNNGPRPEVPGGFAAFFPTRFL